MVKIRKKRTKIYNDSLIHKWNEYYWSFIILNINKKINWKGISSNNNMHEECYEHYFRKSK